jgi:2-aminoethylphosphonate-pyruvate transaminase
MDDDIPYLLLTPGPLTTSRSVKQAMLRDYCTWDDDYNQLVTQLRADLVRIAGGGERHTTVLMQGSGTFGVEATIGSVIPPDGKLLVINNGAYG